MIGGILFFVIELKTLTDNNLAQVFLELLCTFFLLLWTYSTLSHHLAAAEMNERLDFAGLRIYGLLTDLEDFRFYSYDPSTKQFCFDEYIVVSNKRVPAFHDMIEGLSISPFYSYRPDFFQIFGLLLTAYVDGLSAIVKRSRDRAKANNVSPSQYIEHNITHGFLVFVQTFRTCIVWRSCLQWGKFLKPIDWL